VLDNCSAFSWSSTCRAIPNNREVGKTTQLVGVVQDVTVHRHAKAKSAAIRIERTAGRVTILIADNGIGMSIFSPSPQGDPILGIGISGMRQRVKQLNGEFLVSSSVGIGTTIQVVLPFTEKEGSK
jgi:signal transduction histidine kinase